jgi:hypothetical protein
MSNCITCLGTGEQKKCTCHDVINGRESRCQSFEKIRCWTCGGSGEQPTWGNQLVVRPDIDNSFAMYK